MGAFARSWHLTRLSFKVISQDKELLLFPILAGFFSIGYVAVVLVPLSVFTASFTGDASSFTLSSASDAPNAFNDMLAYAFGFLIYFGLAFIATFFNVCVVYTTKVRFEGGNATFFESLRFALQRIHLIFSWSLLAASVGMLFRMIEHTLERAGPIGRAIGSVLVQLLGAAWGVVTLFVVPAMVFDGLGPIEAVRRSMEVLKRTWGESLIRHYGLGFVFFLMFMAGGVMMVGTMMAMGSQLLWIPIVIYALYLVVLVCTFNVANTIFNVALYTYADTGTVPRGYDEDVMRDAVGQRV